MIFDDNDDDDVVAAAADDDDDNDDDDMFSNSSNYLQDFNQSKLFTMIIIMKRDSELQEEACTRQSRSGKKCKKIVVVKISLVQTMITEKYSKDTEAGRIGWQGGKIG